MYHFLITTNQSLESISLCFGVIRTLYAFFLHSLWTNEWETGRREKRSGFSLHVFQFSTVIRLISLSQTTEDNIFSLGETPTRIRKIFPFPHPKKKREREEKLLARIHSTCTEPLTCSVWKVKVKTFCFINFCSVLGKTVVSIVIFEGVSTWCFSTVFTHLVSHYSLCVCVPHNVFSLSLSSSVGDFCLENKVCRAG